MKVAFDHQILQVQRYGGISRYFIELAHALNGLPGFEASAVAPTCSRPLRSSNISSIPCRSCATLLEEAPAVLLSTELIVTESTPSPDWWYLGPEHGQHIGFFRLATLHWMAEQLGCHSASDGRGVHLFSRSFVSASWRTLLRLSRMWPVVARARLHSKTQSDFDHLRDGSRAAPPGPLS